MSFDVDQRFLKIVNMYGKVGSIIFEWTEKLLKIYLFNRYNINFFKTLLYFFYLYDVWILIYFNFYRLFLCVIPILHIKYKNISRWIKIPVSFNNLIAFIL